MTLPHSKAQASSEHSTKLRVFRGAKMIRLSRYTSRKAQPCSGVPSAKTMSRHWLSRTVLGFLLAQAAILCAQPASASVITELHTLNFLDNQGPNIYPLQGGVGLFDAFGIALAPAAGTTATATQNGVTVAMTPPDPNSVFPNDFSGQVPFSPGLTGAWTVTANNPSTPTAVFSTLALTGVTPPGFATSLGISGGGGAPLVASWLLPPGNTANQESIFVIDHSAGDGVVAVSRGAAATVNSFTIPTASLNPAHQYYLEINAQILVPGTDPVNFNPSAIEARSETFSGTFTPSEVLGSVELPVVAMVSGPGAITTPQYQFNFSVLPGDTYALDPVVATGFKYQTGSGDPNFACVTPPTLQPSPFHVSFLEGGSTVSDAVSGGSKFCFPVGGVSAFDVLGIDPNLGLDPNNTMSFVTDVSFVGPGDFTGSMTPITESVPEPGSLAL